MYNVYFTEAYNICPLRHYHKCILYLYYSGSLQVSIAYEQLMHIIFMVFMQAPLSILNTYVFTYAGTLCPLRRCPERTNRHTGYFYRSQSDLCQGCQSHTSYNWLDILSWEKQ